MHDFVHFIKNRNFFYNFLKYLLINILFKYNVRLMNLRARCYGPASGD
jgi:hypothetical protein